MGLQQDIDILKASVDANINQKTSPNSIQPSDVGVQIQNLADILADTGSYFPGGLIVYNFNSGILDDGSGSITLDTSFTDTRYATSGSYQASGAYQPAGNYLTSASAASTYITSASVAAVYLTSASAASIYLTSASAAINYINSASVAANYLSSASAASIYLTSASAVLSYLSSASAAAVYLTSESAALNYATSASVAASIVSSSNSTTASFQAILTSSLASYEKLTNKSNDTTLISSSVTLYPTQNAVKTYVDNKIFGLTFTLNVKVASTGSNIDTGSAPSTLDGVILLDQDRILLKDQTDQTQNGIYIISSSVLVRSNDAMTGSLLENKTIPVTSGIENQDTWWTVTNNSIIIGTTNIIITQTGGKGSYNNGEGILKVGNTFSLDVGFTDDRYAASGSYQVSGAYQPAGNYQASGAYQPAGNYLTSASAASTYQPIGTYLTSASAASTYQPIGTYITSASVASNYQPIGSYLSSASAASTYITSASVAANYITSASVAVNYQPKGNYQISGSYLTSASAASTYQPIGTYLTSASAAAVYLTSASIAAAYAPSGSYQVSGSYLTSASAALTYLTSASAANIYITSASVATVYLSSASAATIYLTSASAVINYLTPTIAAATYLTSASAAINYQLKLNGLGFVKASGSVISYDNSTYILSGSIIALPSGSTAFTLPVNNSGSGVASTAFVLNQFTSSTIYLSANTFTGSGALGSPFRINLTTNSSSGAATLISGTLNIPIYGGGGGSGTVTNIATGLGLTGGPITATGTISINTSSSITWNTGSITQISGIGTGSVDGLYLYNSSAATSILQQYTPTLHFRSFGWSTSPAGSIPIDFTIQAIPVSATTAFGRLTFKSSVNGGASTTLLTIDSFGSFVAGNTFFLQPSNFGSGSTDGIVLQNTTNATLALKTQYSSRVRYIGSVWNLTGGVFNSAQMLVEMRVSSSATPGNSLYWSSYIGASTTPIPNDIMSLDNLGNLSVSGSLKIVPVTFASRPTNPTFGQIASFSDSNTVVWGTPVTGSGTNKVFAGYNGTAWTVMGK